MSINSNTIALFKFCGVIFMYCKYTSMSDEKKILVLACKIKFRNTVNEQNISAFNNDYFELGENDVNVSIVDWIDQHDFEEQVDNLIAFSREIRNKIKGDVLVYIRGSDDSVATGKYHVGSKEWGFTRCDINISVKQPSKDKPKQLTEEEKIALFREYWQAKHTVPGKNEIYKGFKIGGFYSTAMKNEDLIAALKDIMA